jgi:hypothetical protein
MLRRVTRVSCVFVTLLVLAVLAMPPATGNGPPDVVTGYQTEVVAPGVWRVLDDGMDHPLDRAMTDIRVGPDGSVWALGRAGAFELGGADIGPADVRVDRILAIDDEGVAWLRYQADGREGFGTWDGRTWTDRSGARRASASSEGASGAPGVIRDFALAADGTIWVVAGEQSMPRWERFTVEHLDEGGWDSLAIGDGLPELRCGGNCGDGSRIVAAADGTVWVSVDQGGLLRHDGAAWEVVRPLGGDVDRPVVTLTGDPHGWLWADVARATDDRPPTLARFDGTSWETPRHAQTDPALRDARSWEGRPIAAVAPDGTLWSAGHSPQGDPVLSAIDGERLRGLADLGLCSDELVRLPAPEDTAAGPSRCWKITSLATTADGLIWLTAGPRVARYADDGGEGALLLVDPELASTS